MSILKFENATKYPSKYPEIEAVSLGEPIFSSRSEEIQAKLLGVLIKDLKALYPDKNPEPTNINTQDPESDSTVFYGIKSETNNDSNYETTISFDHKEDPHNPGQQIYRTLTATFKSNQITSLGVSWSWEPNLKA